MMHLLFNRTTQWLFYILGKIILFGGGLFYILGSNNLFGQHCLFYVLGNIILLYQENRIFCLLVRYCYLLLILYTAAVSAITMKLQHPTPRERIFH